MSHNTQRGATALFVVIFAALLLSVITVSFVAMINRDRMQSTDNELSQSAYDAALAGVEDAKRVISACLSGDSTACTALAANTCQTVHQSGVIASSSESETLLRSTAGDGEDINQAYTCVRASLDSDDVLYHVAGDQGLLIPLRAASEVRTVRIEWQQPNDVGIAMPLAPDHATGCDRGDLCPLNQWGDGVPSLLRAQLITPGSQIDLGTIDNSDRGMTAFLYPSQAFIALGGGNETTIEQAGIPRYTASGALANTPQDVTDCSNARFITGYACAVNIELRNLIPANSDVNFIRLTSLYKGASVRVSLYSNSGNLVSFRSIQPVVDSTGRANDVFRRVEARLSTVSPVIQPVGAVELTDPAGSTGNLCKDFSVTNNPSHATSNFATPCSPSGS